MLSLAIILLTSAGCKLPKVVKDNQLLLDRNVIRGGNDELNTGINENIKQKPNRKILGAFKFHLNIYRLGAMLRGGKVANYLMNTIGERPVILDSNLVDLSIKQIEQFLLNKGYFRASTTFTVKKILNLATVTYHIQTGPQFTIDSVLMEIPDSVLAKLIKPFHQQNGIKTGESYTNDKLGNERLAITEMLRNVGYFQFQKEYITFDLDTIDTKVEVHMNIDNPPGMDHHPLFYVDAVDVIVDSNVTHYAVPDTLVNDSIRMVLNRYKIRPDVLSKSIFIRPNTLFSMEQREKTYSRLVNLQVFKFVDIRFYPVPDKPYHMVSQIRLTPMVKQEITLEPQVTFADQQSTDQITQSSRNYGLTYIIRYSNRNALKNADIFNIRLKNSYEAQTGRVGTRKRFFNSIEFSTQAQLDIPSLPKVIFRKNPFKGTTQINTSVIFETNNDFNRRLWVTGLNWGWRKPTNRNWGFALVPAEISFIRTDNFSSVLQSLFTSKDSSFYRNLFGRNFITAGRFSVLFNNSMDKNRPHAISLKWNVLELSGNVLNVTINQFNRWGVQTEPGKIFGVNYFQYAKMDIDFRYYRRWTSKHSTVWRFFGGAGIPYGNSGILPFEKRYFIGGSNSLRAWQPRTLGPGSYKDPINNINQTGDIKLESNLEERFPLFWTLEGAVFLEGGNIWFHKADATKPGADFHINSFYKSFAMDGGIGLRINLQFFLFRVDAALPFRDPGLSTPWKFASYNSGKSVFQSVNLTYGIGYPF